MTVRTVIQENAPTIMLSDTSDDSGGPVVDRDGKLVGIVTGAATDPADHKVTLAIGTAEIRAFLVEKDKPIPPVVPEPKRSEPPPDPIVRSPDPFISGIGPLSDPRPLPEDFNAEELYDKCVKSTVFIATPLKAGVATGSGSLIDAEKRYVLTNYHVVKEEDHVYVQFPVRNKDGSLVTDKKKYIERIPAGQALKGKVLYRDKTRDLALIQLDKLPPDTKALPLAKKSVTVGEPVINVGSPGAVDWTFSTTRGTVRGIGVVDVLIAGGDELLRFRPRMVTVSNPISPSDSGGPLVDKRGYLVGVTEGGQPGAQNVSNCIDVTEVWGFLLEKKVTIKDLTAEKGEVAKPTAKVGLDSVKPKIDTPPVKTPGTTPPPSTTTPKVDPRPATNSDPPPTATPADEKEAAKLLQSAKLFKDGDDQEYYKSKLKAIVTKYPTTEAGKEAKTLLDALK
jgi:S1-C subfamily serine protease